MKRVEIKLRDIRVVAIEIMPANWWARLLLSLAHWQYKLEFRTHTDTTLERYFGP